MTNNIFKMVGNGKQNNVSVIKYHSMKKIINFEPMIIYGHNFFNQHFSKSLAIHVYYCIKKNTDNFASHK